MQANFHVVSATKPNFVFKVKYIGFACYFPIIFKSKLTGEESLSYIVNVLINVFTELIPLSIFFKEKIQFLHSMCVYIYNVVQILTSVYMLLVVFI